MGLDHGLYKKHYVKNWDHYKPNERYQVIVLKGRKPDRSINADQIEYVVEEVITWRKANQIHRWFVKNVQNGKDDCQEYYVSKDQLELLVGTCEKVIRDSKLVPGKVYAGTSYADGKTEEFYEDGKVIDNPKTAKRLLPTTEGFFFGSTQYDEWYLDELRRTVEVLKAHLEQRQDVDYRYWSSW